MSRHDGRVVVLDVDMNFAVTNLANSGDPVADPGNIQASAAVVRLDMHNTSTDCVKVYAGKAAATASLVAKVGPGVSVSVPTLLSAGHQLYFKSVAGAVTSGRLFIAGYN
jgi:hypothetical protein